MRRCRSERSQLGDQLGGPVRIAPLVVVPADDLDEVAVDDQGLVGHEDAGMRVADDVAGDQRVGAVFEDALERASAAVLIAALTWSRVARAFSGPRSGRSTEPTGTGTRSEKPVSLPFSSGMTSPTALAAPGLGGNDVHGGGARAIGVFVDLVGDALVVGVGVNVVISPFSIPNASCRTLAIGARQLVVHDALEMMR